MLLKNVARILECLVHRQVSAQRQGIKTLSVGARRWPIGLAAFVAAQRRSGQRGDISAAPFRVSFAHASRLSARPWTARWPRQAAAAHCVHPTVR